MTYTIQKALPHPKEVKDILPLSDTMKSRVEKDRQEIYNILKGKDQRKLLIIGPCSAWPNTAVIEYAKKLKPLADRLSDKLKIVLRIYTQKPRTTIGWTGPLSQPDPYAKPDIEKGIFYCRKMMLDIINIGLPIADEALFTHNDGYFVDLITWIAIGARSSEDQEHRIFASMIPHPTGIKNPTSGNIPIAINSIIAAQHPHVFALHGRQVQTSGNPYSHLILRGGSSKPNYSLEHIQKSADLMNKKNITNPGIIIDLSHDNSVDPETGKKDPLRQPLILNEIMDSISNNRNLTQMIKGFMVESFLHDGNQNLKNAKSIKEIKAGLSVTDGCLGWEKTKSMITNFGN